MRPYEPLGMTTEKWKLIQPELVEIGLLIATQDHLADGYIESETSYCGDKYVHVVLFEGRHYLSDGHNRISKLISENQTHTLARVKRISFDRDSVLNKKFEIRKLSVKL